MRTKYGLALIVIIFLRAFVFADSPAPERPLVAASPYGRAFFKMVPAKCHFDGEKLITDQEAFGVAYEVGENGEFIERWKTTGWYSFEVYLSEDGDHVVRMGPWASDQDDLTDLAVAFYHRDKLLKEYQVKDLIKDRGAVVNSVSHYEWRASVQSKPTGFDNALRFHLVFADKTAYDFEVETGKILEVSKDERAKSKRDIWNEEQEAARRQGAELFRKSSFKPVFESLFEVTEVTADLEGKVSGVYFDEPEWRAHLTPKKKLTHKAMVEAVFPVRESNQVAVSVTPEQIDAAFESCFAHPFVSERFKKGDATGVRLRITGDRLHWNTPELKRMIKQVRGNEPADSELLNWAYLIIDGEPAHFTSVYLNKDTGELIYEDKAKWPWEPMLLDKAGARKSPPARK